MKLTGHIYAVCPPRTGTKKDGTPFSVQPLILSHAYTGADGEVHYEYIKADYKGPLTPDALESLRAAAMPLDIALRFDAREYTTRTGEKDWFQNCYIQQMHQRTPTI